MTDDDYDPEADSRLSYGVAIEALRKRHVVHLFWIAVASIAVGVGGFLL